MSEALLEIARKLAALEARVKRSEKMEFGTAASLRAAGFALTSDITTDNPSMLYAKAEKVNISTSGETDVFNLTLPANFFASGGGSIRFGFDVLIDANASARGTTPKLYIGATSNSLAFQTSANTVTRARVNGSIFRTGVDTQMGSTNIGLIFQTGLTTNYYPGPYVSGVADDAAEIVVRFTLQLSGTVDAGWFGGVVVEKILDT
jgi:hypothetical protein